MSALSAGHTEDSATDLKFIMNNPTTLEDCYQAVIEAYTVQKSDEPLQILKKMLVDSEIKGHQRNQYISGLEQLVAELRHKINFLEKEIETLNQDK